MNIRLFQGLATALILALSLCISPSTQGKEKSDQNHPSSSSSSSNSTLSSQKIFITTYGASGRVSGSLTAVELGNSLYLVDCGIYYPEYEVYKDKSLEEGTRLTSAMNNKIPIEASNVKALVLTHAHLDHVGRIPQLYQQGFRGKILCTEGTAKLLPKMLTSRIRYSREKRNYYWYPPRRGKVKKDRYQWVHWNKDCFASKWKGKKGTFSGTLPEMEKKFTFTPGPCRTCARKDLAPMLKLVEKHSLGSTVNLLPAADLKFLDAGHIPGSSSLLFKINTNKGTKKLLFSGDLGSDLSPFQDGPKVAPPADAIWVESTYGRHRHCQQPFREMRDFKAALGKAVKNNGIAWIPAFALDRTQKVLYYIKEAKEEGYVPKDIPVYCPSSTARSFTSKYRREHQKKEFGWFRDRLYNLKSLFPKGIKRRYPRSSTPRPAIVVTTSGDMGYALSQALLDDLLPDDKTTVFLVGYADPRSPAGQLNRKLKEVKWQGEKHEVKAKVKNFYFFSGHGDVADILKWLSNQKKDTAIYLVHGGKKQLRAQKSYLEKFGFTNVHIAKKGGKISLK